MRKTATRPEKEKRFLGQKYSFLPFYLPKKAVLALMASIFILKSDYIILS